MGFSSGIYYGGALLLHTFTLSLNIASGRSNLVIAMQVFVWFALAWLFWRSSID